MAKKEKRDDEVFRHQISYTDDQKMWVLTIECDSGVNAEEFAGACIALGKDILNKKITFDDSSESDLQ